jgi:hypothetical protein
MLPGSGKSKWNYEPMTNEGAKHQEYQIGTYTCPKTKAQVPLMDARSMAFIHWPLEVKQCASCGEEHKLESTDVLRPPVYGRE